MKRDRLPVSIGVVFLLSLLYWLYLACTTRMDIVFDAIGYESLGRMLHTSGWITYFKTGPNREPLYPLLIAAAMGLSDITGLAYVKIMAFFGVVIMFLTQALMYIILRLLKIRNGICILVLGYLAVSPALTNAAFSLYSEIAAFPIILGIILTSWSAWEAMRQNKPSQALGYGGLLGLLLTAATFVKAVFECVAPVYLLMFFIGVAARDQKKQRRALGAFILCILASVLFYYVPVMRYKWLNKEYNGNFAVTNRGSWALYGNTARRMEPLTLKSFEAALAYAPGEGVCNSIFGAKTCDFWSYRKSDEFGYGKWGELTGEHLSETQVNTTLLKLSAQKALGNPFQYGLLTFIEGTKMFFWESTKIGFVEYPARLQKLYDIKILNNGLRLVLFLASAWAVASLWIGLRTPQTHPIGFLMGVLIFLYILFFSFFFILTRYALPIAPLYLISIGLWMDQKFAPKKAN